MTTASTDPFSKCYDAVLSLLFDGVSNQLANGIQVGNRITFNSETNREPDKLSIASADLPEVRLLDEGGVLNLHANSDHLQYIQNLTLIIQTGDWRYAKFCSKLHWATIVNMSQWRTLLGGVTWNGKPYIKNIEPSLPVQIGESNPERNRGIAGWTAVWRVRVTMMISHADIVYQES